MVPYGTSGLRVFVGDKIAGVPNGLFNNESAFCEFILSFIIDNPIFAFDLTDAQVVELNSPETNVAEWVIRKWENGAIKLKSDLLQRCIKSIELVSNSKEQYQFLAKSILNEAKRGTSGLDSLLSRTLRNKIANARTPASKFGWKFFRVVNDFVLAPIGETGLFYMLFAASGSLLMVTAGLLIFVGLHFWDDYIGGKSTGLSPPDALELAFKSAVSRFVRASILYAAPFAIYMVFPNVLQILADVGMGVPSALSGDNELLSIAGLVSLLHAGRNIINHFKARSGLFDQAQKDGRQIAAVLFGKPDDLPTDKLVRNQASRLAFPATDSLQVETLGSPGQRFLSNVGSGLQNNTYSAEFGAALLAGVRSYLSRERGQVPSTAQMLARLQVFVLGGAFVEVDTQSGGVGEKIPVQLEIITAKDLPVLSKTLEVMKAVNEDQKKPLRLLLAGVDTETVKALKELVKGFDDVSLMDNPVGVGIEKSDMWRLNPGVLNQGFRDFQTQFRESFSLSVSLSEGISFSEEDLDLSGSSPVDPALKEALLHYLLSPLQPLHCIEYRRRKRKLLVCRHRRPISAGQH